ncbi:hypothetical protein HKX48_004585 [Thoreauomyces humboldtii]|nr:hypothetical protein HKX48_004585 [Thoreauomyces humboldtii]
MGIPAVSAAALASANATHYCDSLKVRCAAEAALAHNGTCTSNYVYACHEPATKSKDDWCFKCNCGTKTLLSSMRCASVPSAMLGGRNSTTPTTTNAAPSPKRTPKVKPHDTSGTGTIAPQPAEPQTIKGTVDDPPSDEKVRLIGGGVGGTIGGVVLVAAVGGFLVARKRRARFGKPYAPAKKVVEGPVDEFNADTYKRSSGSSRPSMASVTETDRGPTEVVDMEPEQTFVSSSMPALALLARSDSMSRQKAASPSSWVHSPPPLMKQIGSNPFARVPSPTNPFDPPGSSRSASPFGPSPSIPASVADVSQPDTSDESNELYLQHLREREEMRQHWQQRSSSPSPPPAEERPATPQHVVSPRLAFSPAPLHPSPLRTSSTVSIATTESNDSSRSLNAHVALSGHFPQVADELSIQPGDRVVVWRVWEDGWCQGTLLRTAGAAVDEAYPREGVFPVRCVRCSDDVGDVGTLCGWEGPRHDSLGR